MAAVEQPVPEAAKLHIQIGASDDESDAEQVEFCRDFLGHISFENSFDRLESGLCIIKILGQRTHHGCTTGSLCNRQDPDQAVEDLLDSELQKTRL